MGSTGSMAGGGLSVVLRLENSTPTVLVVGGVGAGAGGLTSPTADVIDTPQQHLLQVRTSQFLATEHKISIMLVQACSKMRSPQVLEVVAIVDLAEAGLPMDTSRSGGIYIRHLGRVGAVILGVQQLNVVQVM